MDDKRITELDAVITLTSDDVLVFVDSPSTTPITKKITVGDFLGSLQVSLVPNLDSSVDLGSSSKYWANLYSDKIYLNATATISGATAGELNVVGNVKLSSVSSLYLYGTADLVNYERGFIGWSGSEFYVQVQNSGTGTLRNVRIQAGSTVMSVNSTNVALTGDFKTTSASNSPWQLIKTGSTGISFSSYYPTVAFNMYHNGTQWIAQGTAFVGALNQTPTTGLITLGISAASRTADAGLGSNPTVSVLSITYDGKMTLGGTAPWIQTASNANLVILPNGTGYTIIGDAGTTSHSFNTNDDLFVSGRLEVDGVAYLDGTVRCIGTSGADTFISDIGGSAYVVWTPFTDDGIHIAVRENEGTANNNLILTNVTNRGKNFDHATASVNPTLFIHSNTDPDTNNTQWISFAHNQTNGVINTGTGNLTVGQTVTSDTDSTDNLGTPSIFWANAYIDKIYLNSTQYIDGATNAWIDIQGEVDIAGPLYLLHTVSTAVSDNGLYIFSDFTPTAANKIFEAMHFGIVTRGTQNVTNLYAINGTLNHDSNGTITSMKAISIDMANTGGACNSFAGLSIIWSSTNNITTAYGFYLENLGISTGKTITTHYGIYVLEPNGLGAVTNNYGIYLGNFSKGGTLNYAIYTNAGLIRFGGIVNTTESYQVDGVQVLTNRVIDARCDDAINSGDATTDGVIDALRDAMIAHGLIAAA